MKITVFTSNKYRHNYLINKLSEICDSLYVIQECTPYEFGSTNSYYRKSKILKNYFVKVSKAEIKIFNHQAVKPVSKNLFFRSLIFGELSNLKKEKIKNFLKSDLYIIFGSSYIKGELLRFLVKKKAINIHMGISPYYRGSDCNFWALYDDNAHLVGATIHYLSKIDGGKILYHSLTTYNNDKFLYTMKSVKSAVDSIVKKIKTKSLFTINSVSQNSFNQIRY